jgi:tetratricopeptide (TPR) repeat protein
MTSMTQPTTAQSIDADIQGFAFTRALARLADPKDGGALDPVTAGLLRARAQVGREHWHAAYDTLQSVRGRRDLGTAQRLEAQVATAKVLRIGWWSTDAAIDLALAAAKQALRIDAKALAVEAHLEAALLFGRKRTRKLANAQLAAAEAIGVDAARVASTRGDLAITFDERPLARESFEAALATPAMEARGRELAARLGRIGLARLFTITGEFGLAAEHIAALGERPAGDVAVRRLAWQLAAAQGQWPVAATLLGEILAAIPDGDASRSLMLEHASAMYRGGDLEGARAAWTKIAATGGGDFAARVAAGVLDSINSGNTRRTRLQAFPSVTQLRDHCGPASVELCLRFFGMAAEQVDVAREIKHPDGGTPVHRMRQYMDAAGFHTRRIEADLDKLRAILDAGVPVILEEDYSTTRHVAVAIGYDDQRQLLEVQDPMTHEIRETRYAELPKLREFSNHGALVAVPAGRDDLVAALDRIGATECAYISTTDRAWEAHDQNRGEDADRLVEEAIALHEAYELAWVLKFVRAQDRHRKAQSPESAKALADVLDAIVRLWPDDEWPQQFVGRVRDSEGRYGEALAAFERARDRDPGDANNWCSIGDCHVAMGNHRAAREAFENALRRDWSHVRSNENLADIATDDGDASLAAILNDVALERAPDNAFNWYVRGKIRGRADDLPAGIEAFAKAVELRPGSSGFALEHARLLARAGRVDEALEGLAKLRAERPKDTYLLTNTADLAYNYGRFDECLAVCGLLAEVDPSTPSTLALGGAAKCSRGELDHGIADLRKALSKRPTYAWAQRELGVALAKAERWDDAITSCAAAVGLGSSADALFRLGDVLARAGHTHDGAHYLRRAAGGGALDVKQLDRVAEVIASVNGFGGAHDFLGGLTREFSRAVAPARAHARLLLETTWAPQPARQVISHLSELAPQDPFVLAFEADDLMSASIDDEARGEALFRTAIDGAGDLVAPRRLFAKQLLARGRFAEALEVVKPCPPTSYIMEARIDAILGLQGEDEARRVTDEWAATIPEERRELRRRPILYRIAKAMRQWDEALTLATELGKGEGELDDDGKLSRWEIARFEALLGLGRADEAMSFGRAQCGGAADLGDLAYAALGLDAYEPARALATASYAIDANEVCALAVLARMADRDGDLEKAASLWQRMKAITPWHIHDENLGRLALARGDLEAATPHLEAAVVKGHTCWIALHMRAELRLLRGDRDGAKADAQRAIACRPLMYKGASHDLDGLAAGLEGKAEESRAAYHRWESGDHAASDRARVAAVRGGLGAA